MNNHRHFRRATAFGAAGVLCASLALAENSPSQQRTSDAARDTAGEHHADSSPRTMAEQGLSLDTPAQPARSAQQAASTSPSTEEVRQLQEVLRDQLLYDGNIDGIAGPQTRAALRAFQTREQLQITGTLNQATRNALGIGGTEADAQRQPVSGQSATGQQDGSNAIQRLGGSEEVFRISDLTSEHTREIQSQLLAQGLYQGEVDGLFGPLTRSALVRFFNTQAAEIANGRLSAEALEFFNLDPSALSQNQVSGSESGSEQNSDDRTRTTPGGAGEAASPGLPPQPTRRDAPSGTDDPMNPQPQNLPGTPDREFDPAEMPPEGYQR